MKTDHTEHKFTNSLINENSPYLLSHAHNPVNWYPWGEEALAKAKAEDKPIFLSIGYAACHWCHVMERESFENEAIAALMNQYFICIKVDREQRPDLDQIYMSFTTAMTGRGGWPMSVFLTPDLKPFYAGTYFPPKAQYGRPGFTELITEIGIAYQTDKENIIKSSENIFAKIVSQSNSAIGSKAALNKDMVSNGATALMQNFDHTNGGFGSSPKFPHAMELALFLRQYKRSGGTSFLQAVEKALQKMANGGIYDHLEGGFSRYSTDAKWLVPHFEKMLYDNSMLVTTYLDAYLVTENPFYLKVVSETLDFLLDEMRDETGGFYSALDADSEGEEGKFYVWSKKEIENQMSVSDAEIFCKYFNVTTAGNFEHHNILNLTDESYAIKDEMNEKEFSRIINGGMEKLRPIRAKRIRPLTDDKILTSWNGLALSAFARGYQLTKDKRYLEAAVKNAAFVKDKLYRDKKLTHAYREGIHSDGQFLEDYAFYIRGLLDLYEIDQSKNHHQWLKLATELAESAMTLFMDEKGKLFLRPDALSDLIMRPNDETDGAIPAPGSIMIGNWVKLHRLTGKDIFIETAEKGLAAIVPLIQKHPGGMTTALMALDYYLNEKVEIVIVGDGAEKEKMLDLLYQTYLPNRVITFDNTGETSLPLFENRSVNKGELKAYLCVNSVCKLPVGTADELKKQLEAM